jgi:hypothetical protein
MDKFAHRSWRRSAILAFAVALVCTISSGAIPAFAWSARQPSLIGISSDPYTDYLASQHKTEVEPDTFGFGSTIVSAFQVGRLDHGSANIGWATSQDKGKTWTHGFLPGITKIVGPTNPYDLASDPVVAYDAKHGLWLIASLALLNTLSGPTDVAVLVSRSADGGLTWGNPVVVHQGTPDKNWIVCDNTAKSRFYGNCYVEWDEHPPHPLHNNLILMSTSTDGGVTWEAPKTTANSASGLGGQPLVQPSGRVIVPISNRGSSSAPAIVSFISIDGGASWSNTFPISPLFTLPEVAPPINLRDGSGFVSAEIDHSGKVYVVWKDCRFEPGCLASNSVANDLVMSSSTDGLTWSIPTRIPIDPIGSGVDHLIPGLAVDRSTAGNHAHLGLAYYYLSNANCATNTCQLNVGFISSINGGKSWSRASQLAGPMRLTWLANSSQGRMVGDYISTSILPGDDDAFPVFAIAFAPKGGAVCGDPGVVCNEAMYTTPQDLAHIVGGTNTSAGDLVVATLKQSGIGVSRLASGN